MGLVVVRISNSGGGMKTAELHEGPTRMTLQDLIDFAADQGLDPSGTYVSSEFSWCYGVDEDHDKHIEVSWTLSNRHPSNRKAQDSQRP